YSHSHFSLLPHLHSFPTRRSSDLSSHFDLMILSTAFMNKLVFIDDDKRELDQFGPLIEGEYTYIHWPNDREKLVFGQPPDLFVRDRKSTRLNSSHVAISYAVFCLK